MRILVKLLVNALIIFALAWVLPGVDVTSYWTALIVAIILGVLNLFVKPLLIILTIPVTIISLGLFLFVINALMILLTDYLVDGFNVNGFWWALLFSILISIMNAAFDRPSKEDQANY
jgi:putative membrane protein